MANVSVKGRTMHRIKLDGSDVQVPSGTSLAAALIAAGIRQLRHSPRAAGPRGAFCMMGICQECLISANGAIVQACLTPTADGMVLERLR